MVRCTGSSGNKGVPLVGLTKKSRVLHLVKKSRVNIVMIFFDFTNLHDEGGTPIFLLDRMQNRFNKLLKRINLEIKIN